MMGILPLQHLEGENAAGLGLTGKETFDINLPQDPQVGQLVDVVARKGAEEIAFQARLRFDAEADIRYYENGGIFTHGR